MVLSPEHEAEKRRLRAAIGRSRRRIDRRVRAGNNATRRLASWKTYARRYPAAAIAGGLALGWILAAGLRPRVLVGVLGGRFARQLGNRSTELLCNELKRFWSETVSQKEGTSADRGDHA